MKVGIKWGKYKKTYFDVFPHYIIIDKGLLQASAWKTILAFMLHGIVGK